jgi:type VI secretion system protein ImpL
MIEEINTFFQRIGDHFAKLTTLPTLIIGLIILGIVIIIITILVIVISLRQGAKKKAEILASQAIAENPDDAPPASAKNLPPLYGPFSEYFVKKGYIQVSDLSKSFFSALEFLRSALNSPNYKYRLPWYLLIGSESSGKSSLIEASTLNLPAGTPGLGENNRQADCKWWFLNRGVILDIKGKFLINERGTGSNENGWRSLLILLSRYRAARPINGIIYTISAEELYGKKRLSPEEISDRATFLSHKLQAAQNNLGLRLPVYVVLTKCDVIPGFQSICAEIPPSNKQNIFGWSSPYNPTVAFSSKWIEEAFSSIMKNLDTLSSEILSSSRPQETRDGVFVFPVELLTVKEHLSIYLSRIFKVDSYQETPLLRGIYFVGDSGIDTVNHLNIDALSDSFSGNDGNEYVDNMLSPDKRKIFFIDDLINEKIFYEAGIAKPLTGRTLSINRGINIAKIATAGFAAVGSIGLYSAYERFSEQRSYMMPVLQKMNTLLYEMQKIQINQPGQSALVFETYAREFMDMMNRMQNASFFSVFVPASWFSPIRRDMNETLKVSYQQIIIRTIYIDLLIKARELLNMRPTLTDRSESLAHLLKPLTGKEWTLVKNYVTSLTELENMIFKFNNLRSSSDARDLDELVAFTFRSRLPQQFIENYKSIRALLENMTFPSIDLSPYQYMARETLGVLYQNFLNALFNVEDPKSLPGRVNDFLAKLANNKNQRSPDLKQFRQFSLEMTEGTRNIGEPGKTWMDAEYFNPGKEFNDFFDALDANERLFGKNVSQFLVDQTAIGFENLKQQLKTINLTLVGFKAQLPISPIQKQKQETNFSQGILDLSAALEALFNEPYMAEASNTRFSYQIPAGKMLRWDANMIDMAFDMARSFDDFLTKHIDCFPKMIQENLRILARESLQSNIVDLVARAQNFVTVPTSMVDRLQAEEILSSMINDLNAVSPKFIKLLQLMQQGTVGFSFVELRDLLANSYNWMLTQVERLQGTMAPFTVRDQSFSWWDGKVNAAYSAFAVRDQQDLQSYVDIQREQTKRLCKYAEPIVFFLGSQVMMDAQYDKILLNRWRRIVEQFTAAEAKQPNSSYSQLEEFILKTMNTFTASDVPEKITLDEIKQPSGDYFTQIMQTLKKGMLGRSEILKRQYGFKNYEKLSQIFNTKIRGKFPFVTDVNLAKDEVDPADLRDFFQQFDQFGGTPDKILDQIYQLGDSAKPLVTFLEDMSRVRELLEAFITNKTNSFSLDITADFRVNRTQESNAERLADSYIQVGEARLNKQTKTARWYAGSPVIFGFRYTDADLKPVGDVNNKNYRVDNMTGSFIYTGRWALLKALNAQEAKSASSGTSYVLGFNIPTTSGSTKVFDRITLSVPTADGKSGGRIMRLPKFPLEAPSISPELNNYMNQAALATGLVQPQKYTPPVDQTPTQGIPDVGLSDYAPQNTDTTSNINTSSVSNNQSHSSAATNTPSASNSMSSSPSTTPPSSTTATNTPTTMPTPTASSVLTEAKNELQKLIPSLGGETPSSTPEASTTTTATNDSKVTPPIADTSSNPLSKITDSFKSS